MLNHFIFKRNLKVSFYRCILVFSRSRTRLGTWPGWRHWAHSPARTWVHIFVVNFFFQFFLRFIFFSLTWTRHWTGGRPRWPRPPRRRWRWSEARRVCWDPPLSGWELLRREKQKLMRLAVSLLFYRISIKMEMDSSNSFPRIATDFYAILRLFLNICYRCDRLTVTEHFTRRENRPIYPGTAPAHTCSPTPAPTIVITWTELKRHIWRSGPEMRVATDISRLLSCHCSQLLRSITVGWVTWRVGCSVPLTRALIHKSESGTEKRVFM